MELRGDGFLTRPVGKELMSDLLELYWQCADFLALCPDTVPSVDMILRDLETTRPQGGAYCGIYLSTGQLAGVLDIIPSGYEGDPTAAFLELLMLGAPYRGQRLGERVFRALESELAAGGARRLCAGVQENNPRALRFWQRMGFRVTSAPKLFEGMVCLDLEKDLPPA